MIPAAWPRLMDRETVAAYLGVCERTFRERVRPTLTPVWIGDKPLWPREDVDAWADRLKVGGSNHNRGLTYGQSRGRNRSQARPKGKQSSNPPGRGIARKLRESLRNGTPPQCGVSCPECDNTPQDFPPTTSSNSVANG